MSKWACLGCRVRAFYGGCENVSSRHERASFSGVVNDAGFPNGQRVICIYFLEIRYIAFNDN